MGWLKYACMHEFQVKCFYKRTRAIRIKTLLMIIYTWINIVSQHPPV